MSEALRYNAGKLRYELIPVIPMRRVVEVYTRGAHKYSIFEDKDGNHIKGQDIPFEEAGKYKKIYDGANNWKLGMGWMETIAAVERHIVEWKLGNRYDAELKTEHLANAVWGLLALLEFADEKPEFDNRKPTIRPYIPVGTKIDLSVANTKTN